MGQPVPVWASSGTLTGKGALMRLVTESKIGVRPDIQALRAAAVMMVVIYHYWPTALPGGYAGVDVFFVISGFLITSHLLREVARTGRVDLRQFWARRARRLLPASLLVAVVTAVTTVLVVPVTFWQDWFKQMAAAVVYVLNWLLAGDSINYLAAENSPSPVQHYWSLSVEEQFYIVWPTLILLALWMARKQLTRVRMIAVVLGAVTVVSFGFSVSLTAKDPAQAYFVTPTRAWEFGLGGLLAIVTISPPARARTILGWAGIAGIFVTAFVFNASTPFPGYTALLPVLATAAVIWVGVTPQKWSLAQVARFRPIQYTGDVSYSLYLWHWPLLVLVPFLLGRDLLPADLWILLLVSFALAAFTKRFIEEPGRKAASLTRRRPRVTFLVTAAAMAIALAVPAGSLYVAREQRAAATAATKQILEEAPKCLGAAAMVETGCGLDDLGTSLYPNVALLKDDNGIAYDCYTQTPQDGKIETCSYGSKSSDATRIAVTGDSHGAMILAGLVSVAMGRNWRIDSYVSRGCTWSTPNNDLAPECTNYQNALQKALEGGHYDAVVTSVRRMIDTTHAEDMQFATERSAAWGPVIDGGTKVIAIVDDPLVPEDLADCVIDHPAAAVAGAACMVPIGQAIGQSDTARPAQQLEPRASVVDVTDLFCTDKVCPMVIGNTVVYRDRHHVTNTFVTTEAPFLGDRIEAALRA